MSKRVTVFIDNSNTYKYLAGLHRVDPNWCKRYDPLVLAQKLVGGRDLIKVMFYCAPPPITLQRSNPQAYKDQLAFYAAIALLPKVEVKYATLTMNSGAYSEKNLDTQMTADMAVMAATNQYDTAIIVSNDGDFVSAAQTAKTLGRRVEVAYFPGSLSMDLNRASDQVRRLRNSYFIKIGSTPPPSLGI